MQNKLLNKINEFDIELNEFIPYGFDKGKIDSNIIKRLKNKEQGKLILVTSINPTKAGEGKTTVSIGLADGLNKIGKKTILALREPSLGPIFGIKGGATGGGLSSVVPENDINLHFNGDFHAITSANNLLSALIDTHIFYGNELDFNKVTWPRTLDVNDRSLRSVKTSLRDDKFIITAASEIMAIMALSNDLVDLNNRISNILIGFNKSNKPIFVKDLGATNALVLLLKDAINPNVVLTKENTLAFIHCGPFANIAHGCNSIIATNAALRLGDYTVTEAGFGSDLGMEKFLDIKTRTLSTSPSVVVLVTTLNSLKVHGKAKDFNELDLDALKEGLKHLKRHIEIIKSYNLNLVIALNRYETDYLEEIEMLFEFAKSENIKVALAEGFLKGAPGMTNLAKLVVEAIEEEDNVPQLTRPYELSDSPKVKIEKITKKIYGATNVEFSKKALEDLTLYNELIKDLPVCIAKTPLSLSDNSKLVGSPKDFTLKIDEIRPSLGAGFFVALTKGINIMPGLNKHSNAYRIKSQI